MTTKLGTCLEGELVSLLIAGHEPALAELFRRFEAKLYTYALKFARQQELAEEILQDVFVSLWEYRAEIDTSLPLSALLYRMTRNKILNALRQETRLAQQRKTYSFSMEVSRDLTEERVVLNDYHRIMDKAIENLPKQRRSIFKMNHLDGMSYDEIAETLGISRNTVRNQMIKSMKYVRDFLSANVDLNINTIIVLHLLTYLA
ncbi:RNA polymerase sigma-70 factor [Fulvivirgaceae bacterium PWU5]|uniref:RNA polymerase sigma-70 factor n=1 Tax=Dawidia cretensis TaxID=2782350 RepID=A0AAP2DY09_9BACT|nr:RNA polymerase sigma-70 factor [Dawidia cretensis]MBT1708474.1 RNA polymerase sigma-70 factor [Dawidia cretensis]